MAERSMNPSFVFYIAFHCSSLFEVPCPFSVSAQVTATPAEFSALRGWSLSPFPKLTGCLNFSPRVC